MQQSKGFVLISALIALVVVSSLAAINLNKAQNQLKLEVLQKDGANAMNACISAQNVAFQYLVENGGQATSKTTVDLSDRSFNPLQKNPSFEISGSGTQYLITTTCYGTEKNVKIATKATVFVNGENSRIIEWSY